MRANCLRVRSRLHLLGGFVGHEAGPDQTVRHQVGQPLGIDHPTDDRRFSIRRNTLAIFRLADELLARMCKLTVELGIEPSTNIRRRPFPRRRRCMWMWGFTSQERQMVAPRQCAILVGGIGSRLGTLTSETPKPLLDCGGRPFLAWILRELSRFGISEVILLAGYKSKKVETFLQEAHRWLPKSLSIRMFVEPFRAGTGGALWHARDLFDESFLLINGDSWFDTNLARLFTGLTNNSPVIGRVLLRSMNDCSRYGSVEYFEGMIGAFGEKTGLRNPGLINAGIYLFSRKVIDFVQPDCSLEKDVLPALASSGMLSGVPLDGYFIDIGVPEDYARARMELPSRLNRPAVFFDRDGVINEDTGWVGSIDRFQWTDGAMEALRFVNDMGFHVFVVTNQAGVARGLYSEPDVVTFHAFIADELRKFGGTIDDVGFCPDHPDAVVSRYRHTSSFRKPGPGMILDLIARWNVNVERSVLIGDRVTAIRIAEAAGIRGYLYEGGNLFKFVESLAIL